MAQFSVSYAYLEQGCHSQEKKGKFQSSSESVESEGILLQVREFCNLLSKSGKSQRILSVVPIDAYFSSFVEWYLN